MALVAFCFVDENVVAMNLRRRHRGLLARTVPVVRRVPGENRTLVSRDRLRDVVDGDIACAEGLLEQDLITGNSRDLRNQGIVGISHLDRVCHGALRLIFQRGCPAIPELRQTVGTVEYSGSASPTL